MTWFKVDDNSAFNAKVLAAGNEAWGAFCRVGAWCAHQLTDGQFSRAIAVTIAPIRIWEKLALVGLVDKLENGEMQMHDYLQRNPSKEHVLRERASTKARVTDLRNGKRNAVTPPVVNGSGNTTPSRPVPPITDPIGSVGAKAPSKRATALPEDWAPDEKDRAYAAGKGWDTAKVSEQAERFRAHHLARGSTMKRWGQAWQTWVLNEPSFRPRQPANSGRFPSPPAGNTGITYRDFKPDKPAELTSLADIAARATKLAGNGGGG